MPAQQKVDDTPSLPMSVPPTTTTAISDSTSEEKIGSPTVPADDVQGVEAQVRTPSHPTL